MLKISTSVEDGENVVGGGNGGSVAGKDEVLGVKRGLCMFVTGRGEDPISGALSDSAGVGG